MRNSKRKEKLSLKNLGQKLVVVSLLILIGGCATWQIRRSLNKIPPTIAYGRKGVQPKTVWTNYDWEIRARCYPDCNVDDK